MGISGGAFAGMNYQFSKLSGHGEAKCKRHDLAMENFQKDRDEWNEESQKRLDFNSTRLLKQEHAKQAITDLKYDNREYYQLFGKRIKPLPPERVSIDYYNPSESQKKGEMAFIIGGTTIVSHLAWSNL